MTWGAPEVLLGLWALPPLGLVLLWALHRRRRAVAALGPLIVADAGKRASSRHRSRFLLLLLGLGLVLTALAQPRWGYRWEEVEREGLNLVVVLDTSASMAAQDVSPSRMERAQREVLDLLDVLDGDRVGMVIFAGGAYPRLPLTLDYGALRTVVRRTDTTALRSQGSDIGAALQMGAKLLGAAGAADRAIVLISDGEDQVGHAVSVAETLAADGIHIYAMGVGTPDGAPVPRPQGGFKKDQAGDLVLSRLDERSLKQIAAAGQGAYVRSVAGSGDIRAIYEDEIRTKLSRASQGVRRDKVWDERYQWPLGLGLLVLLAGVLVRGPRRPMHPGVGLLSLLLLAPQVRADEGEVGRLAAEQVAHPDDLAVAERLGAALFEDGQFNRADEVLTGLADRASDPGLRGRARYNAGLSAYRAGRLTEAAEDWQRMLQDGEHKGAKKNLDSVRRELAKRQDQPPPEQQEGEPQASPPSGDDTGASKPAESPPSEPSPPSDQAAEEQAQPPAAGDTGAPSPPVGERGEISENEEGSAGDTAAAPEVKAVGTISAQEAQRMFDGVEEGRPRVTVDPGSAGGNDW
jgi:Ca-activated chloride channel family protein